MKISYYPGCSLHSTGIEYDISTKRVCEALGVELLEIKDWVCCGSTPAHQSDEIMSIALPMKNIALMKKHHDLNEICVPCASCYSRLKFALERMKDKDVRKKIDKIINYKSSDNVRIIHVLELLKDKIGLDFIQKKVKKNLNGLKIVAYYGCLLTRPPEITGEEKFENPSQMEELAEILGAEGLDWNMKTYCCGAGAVLTKIDIMLELTQKILSDAAAVGAEAIVVACPLCHSNLDTRQDQINKKFKTRFNIPVFYITELIGLALDIKPKELGIFKHLTDTKKILKKRRII